MGKSKGNARILITGDFPALESSFLKEVKAIRERESFQPLLVLVSLKLLGLHLRRFLAEKGVAHFNLRFWTLEEFAREISALHLLAQGKRELPPYADELIIGDIAKSLAGKTEEFYFRDIADRPGFHQALLATIKDLKDGCLLPEDLDRALRDAKVSRLVHLSKLRDLLKLWKAYQNRLKEINGYDESDLMVSAGPWVRDSALFQQTPRILIYGFYDFNAAQKRLLEACFDKKEAIAFIPYEPTLAFEFVKPALEWLKDSGFQEVDVRQSAPPVRSQPLNHLCQHLFKGKNPLDDDPKEIQIISAPGEPREVREVVRAILQASRTEGIPFYEVGILLRTPEEYSRLFREAFCSLGIEPYLREGIPLIETRAGRSLKILLNVLSENFSRRSVMEFATFAKLRIDRFFSEEGFHLNLPRWDAISRQAGIVEGQKEWEERLRRFKESGLKRLEAEEEDEGERGFQKEDLIALDQLVQFIRVLFRSIRQIEGANTWSQKIEALVNAFDELVEEDEDGLLVKQAVRRLSELDVCGILPSWADLVRLTDEALQAGFIRQGRFQRNGPSIVNLMAVRGVPFKMVIVPGMVEKSFPPLIRQDAILLDQERKVLNQSLRGKKHEPLPLKAEARLNEERLLFRLAIGAATERLILSYPRMEIGTGKERLPSSFLLASVEALTGKSVDFNQIEKFPGFVRIPFSEIAVKTPDEALDEVEYDLSVGQIKSATKNLGDLLYLREVSPFFEKGLRLESSRWGKRTFTGYDGILDSKEALQILRERYSIFKRSISPTWIETYATCPYRYLLNGIMGVETLTKPEKEGTISPLDRGKLIHDILYEFYSDLKKERGALLRLRQEDLERLTETARKKFIEFEETGVIGFPMMWEMEKKSMLDCLRDFFNREIEETEFFPAYFEVRFGMKPYDVKKSEISTEEPVLLNIGKNTLRLRGKIDRIDLTQDGKRGRVRDYKTGKVSAKKNEFQGGRTFQLPLYLHAARQLLSRIHRGIEIESAEYYFLKESKLIPFEAAQLDAKEGELQEILETLARGIEDGIFIPVPDNQDCKYRYCDFRMICGSWSNILFNRKSDDPKVKRYLKVTREEPEEIKA